MTSNVPRYSDGTEGNSPSLNFVQSDCLLILQHNVIVILLYVALQYAYDSLQYSTSQVMRFNKLTSVFYASVLLLIMNFVITLSK